MTRDGWGSRVDNMNSGTSDSNSIIHANTQRCQKLIQFVFVLLVLPCVVGTNLVDNPGFETNTGWGTYYGHNVPGDLHYVTSDFTEGSQSLMLNDDTGAQTTFYLPGR